MKFVLVLVVLISAATAQVEDSQRIVGGSLTTINQYPSIVSLLVSSNGIQFVQSCGGSILNTRSILSAAHCVIGRVESLTRVRVGSTWGNSGGVVHNINRFIIHPNYNNRNLDNDIVILRTASTITYNNAVQPARIAGANYNLADNQVVWAAGWGRIYNGGPPSEQLRHVQIWTVNQAICRNRYATRNTPITDNMLCSGWLDVGGRAQCQQDSGGPLYHNGVVVGVCSFGIGCGDPFFPSVDARVSRFTSWIQANS